jgi:hypothetical protein
MHKEDLKKVAPLWLKYTQIMRTDMEVGPPTLRCLDRYAPSGTLYLVSTPRGTLGRSHSALVVCWCLSHLPSCARCVLCCVCALYALR